MIGAPPFIPPSDLYTVVFSTSIRRSAGGHIWCDWTTPERELCRTLADVSAVVLDIMRDGQTVVHVMHASETGLRDATDDVLTYVAHDMARAADRLHDIPSWLWSYGPKWVRDEAEAHYQRTHWVEAAE